MQNVKTKKQIRAEAVARCGKCGQTWGTVHDLVADRHARLNGFQAVPWNQEDGLLLWTHDCGTTFSIPVQWFKPYYAEMRDHFGHKLPEECPRYCLTNPDKGPCSDPCSTNWVREIVAYLSRHEMPPATMHTLRVLG